MTDDLFLHVIDMQEKIAASMEKPELETTVKNVQMLIDISGRMNIPVLLTEQYPKGLGQTIKKIKNSVNFDKVKVLEKLHFDSMKENTISSAITKLGKKTVILAGMEAHICVYQSALGFLAKGYKTFVVSDAVCSRNPAHKDAALAELRKSGVIVLPAESIMYLFIERAGCDDFKYIHKLVK